HRGHLTANEVRATAISPISVAKRWTRVRTYWNAEPPGDAWESGPADFWQTKCRSVVGGVFNDLSGGTKEKREHEPWARGTEKIRPQRKSPNLGRLGPWRNVRVAIAFL